MFAIVVEFLTGRYTASQFNDRSEPEWPPHPARLFSALVAAWADADAPDPHERTALLWLEKLDPPSIECSEADRRTVVTHFVPVNDPTALTRDISSTYEKVSEALSVVTEAEKSEDDRALAKAHALLAKVQAKAVADGKKAGAVSGRASSGVIDSVLEILPERRGRQPRMYPTVVPHCPTVWFIWPDAQPDDGLVGVLDALLGRVGRLGHSSTFVLCRVDPEPPEPTHIPDGEGTEPVRVPRQGMLERLELAFATHRAREPRVLAAATARYRHVLASVEPTPLPLLGGTWIVLGVRRGSHTPSLTRSLDAARATRAALIRHSTDPVPEILSGHSPGDGSGPTPPATRPHLAVVPLANVGHRYSDGTILGVALVLPRDAGGDGWLAVADALRAWHAETGLQLHLPRASSGGASLLIELEEAAVERSADLSEAWGDPLVGPVPPKRRVLTRSYWCRPADRWLTVTPIALDRFPGALASSDPEQRDRAQRKAELTIKRACEYAGLPGPVEVTLRPAPPLSGVPAVGGGKGARHRGPRFPSYRTGGSGQPRVCVHAELVFDTPVVGPVLVGAGRYLGYGLCLPARAAEDLR